jgi:hypothetical protein
MPDAIEENLSGLEKLAKQFDPLTPAEQVLLRHTQRASPLSLKRAGLTASAEERHNAVRSLQKGYDIKRRRREEDDESNRSRSRVRGANRRPLVNLTPAVADTPWAKERSIRSELLHWLCTDSAACKLLNDFSIDLEERRVQGRLNLSHLDIPFPIICRSCWFPDGIDLNGAVITDLILDGSWIGPPKPNPKETTMVFSAEGLCAKGSVLLRGLHAEGEVNLIGADIRGDLSCSEGEFNGADTALGLDRAEIGGNLHLRAKFAAKGQVRLMGATIHGDLDLSSGKCEKTDGDALLAQRVTVNGSVLLNIQRTEYGRFDAKGRVRFDNARIHRDLECRDGLFRGGLVLCGAEIDGQLICTGSRFVRPKAWALNAERAKIRGAAFLGFSVHKITKDRTWQNGELGFFALGEVRFFAASVGNNLICHAGRFHNAGDIALNLEQAKIGGGLMLRYGFDAEGEVRLFGTEVSASLECDKATFRNPAKVALNAEHAKIGSSMMLRNGFNAEGEVRLFGTQIGGSLDCRNGRFSNPGIDLAALRLDRTNIGGAADLSTGFYPRGNVLFRSGMINRDLTLSGADLSADECFLHIRNTEIKGVLGFEHVKISPSTIVDLRDTSCSVLRDDLHSWPPRGKLMLDGFVYRRLTQPGRMLRGRAHRLFHFLFRRPVEETRINDWLRRQLPAKIPIGTRAKEWLRRQWTRIKHWLRREARANKIPSYAQFRPQPYRQLAAVLRAQGLDRDAKTVLIEMARDRRKWGKEGSRLRQWLLWATIRNGYQPIRAGLLLIILWILGYTAFGIGYNLHLMVPTDKDANTAFLGTGKVLSNYEPFCAVTYAIDTSLPIINFGQREKWHPAAAAQSTGTLAPDLGDPVCDASVMARLFHQITRRWFHWTDAGEVDFVSTWLPRVRWVYVAIGWFLTTMFVAGISGLVGRE